MIISGRDDGLVVIQLPNKKVVSFNRGDIWEYGTIRQDVYGGKTLYERRMHKPDKSKIRQYWFRAERDQLKASRDLWLRRWIELEVLYKGATEDLENLRLEYMTFAYEQLGPLALGPTWEERLQEDFPILADLFKEDEYVD